MVLRERINDLQKLSSTTVTQVETFATEHRELLKTAGIVTAAILVGGVGGYLLAKGVLVAKGAVAAKTGAAAAPVLTTQSAASGVATLQNTATLLNNSIAGGTALVDKISALFSTISANAVPLTAGVVGGGAAGVGATRYQVNRVKDELNEQVAQTAAAQAEKTSLENALATAKATLNELQDRLAGQTAPPVVQENLEQIKGIGRVFAQRLNAAGIYTMADLATQTPERLQEIIGTSRAATMVQPADWIQQARQLLQPEETSMATPIADSPLSDRTDEATANITPDRLEAISGITPAIAARLNQAGLFTYVDLAATTVARLQELLGPAIQLPERTLADWIVAARTLATQ